MRAAILGLPLALSACGGALCSSTNVAVTRDPGSDRYAVTQVRDCGATTDFVTVVRVGRASEVPSAATEIFVADSDHGAASAGPAGTIWTNVVWTAPARLLVNHASRARIFKHLAEAKGALVRYRATDRLSAVPVD